MPAWMRTRKAVAVLVVWIGIMTPLALSTNGQIRTRADILAHPFAGSAAIRGGIPILCLAVAVWLMRPRLRPLARSEWALFPFLLLAVVSSIWSIQPLDTFLRSIVLISAYALIFVLARITQGRAIDVVPWLAHILLLTAIAEAVVLPSKAYTVLTAYDPMRRLSGVFPVIHPDFLGLIAGVAIVILAAGRGPRWTLHTPVRFGLIAIYAVALYLSGTRGAMVATVLGLLLLPQVRRRIRAVMDAGRKWASMDGWRKWTTLDARWKWTTVGVGAGLLLVVAYAIQSGLVSTILFRRQGAYGLLTLTGRTITWSHAIAEWLKAPVLGLGYYSGHRFALGEVGDLDNMWLTCLLDLGVVGLLAMGVFVAVAGRDIYGSGDRLRLIVFLMGMTVSFVNPSLETVGYGQLLIGLTILMHPRGIPGKGSILSMAISRPRGTTTPSTNSEEAAKGLLEG